MKTQFRSAPPWDAVSGATVLIPVEISRAQMLVATARKSSTRLYPPQRQSKSEARPIADSPKPPPEIVDSDSLPLRYPLPLDAGRRVGGSRGREGFARLARRLPGSLAARSLVSDAGAGFKPLPVEPLLGGGCGKKVQRGYIQAELLIHVARLQAIRLVETLLKHCDILDADPAGPGLET